MSPREAMYGDVKNVGRRRRYAARQQRIQAVLAAKPPKRKHVADRPRYCCGIPVLLTIDGRVLDDRPAYRGQTHECAA